MPDGGGINARSLATTKRRVRHRVRTDSRRRGLRAGRALRRARTSSPLDREDGEVAGPRRRSTSSRAPTSTAARWSSTAADVGGVSGGSAELGDEADRYAFQGSISFIDAAPASCCKQDVDDPPAEQPDDDFAGAGIWSTPAIDPDAKVAYVGTANPFSRRRARRTPTRSSSSTSTAEHRTSGEIIGLQGQRRRVHPGLSPSCRATTSRATRRPTTRRASARAATSTSTSARRRTCSRRDGRQLSAPGRSRASTTPSTPRRWSGCWTQLVGRPAPFGGIVGSTAVRRRARLRPDHGPRLRVVGRRERRRLRWIGPIADGPHWGPPVAVANGVVYTVDFTGFLDAFDARTGRRCTSARWCSAAAAPLPLSWGGVSVARNTVYAAGRHPRPARRVRDRLRARGPPPTSSRTQETIGSATAAMAAVAVAATGGGGGEHRRRPRAPRPLRHAGDDAASAARCRSSTSTPSSTTSSRSRKGADGRPLFRTPLIGLGQTAPVEGIDRGRRQATRSSAASTRHAGDAVDPLSLRMGLRFGHRLVILLQAVVALGDRPRCAPGDRDGRGAAGEARAGAHLCHAPDHRWGRAVDAAAGRRTSTGW